VFADYLSKVSPEWKTKVGASTSIAWPIGLGGKGSEGVTQQIKQIEGSLGYVELVYASSNKLPVALVSNSAGKFVEPTLEAVTAAAAGAKLEKGTDFRVSLTNAPGEKSYPIASYTWLLVKVDTPDAARAKALRDFLTWMITGEAQQMASTLGYAPLPGDVAGLIRDRIKTLKSGGRPIA
jgi:phosphate transport system substrate-binding protein